MNIPMFKIPASPAFLQYVSIVNLVDPIPLFEHKYLGANLVTHDSLATKVDIDENKFRLMASAILEDRTFYYDHADRSWFVLQDIARIS